VAGIIVGAVVIEQLFSLPGIGRMLVADVGSATFRRCRASCSCSRASCSSSASSSTSSTGHRPAAAGGRMTALSGRDPPGSRGDCGSLSTGRFGVVVVLVIGLTALLARFWMPFDPQKVDVASRWDAGIPTCSAPTARGRDILSLLMAGARTTVWVALGAASWRRSSASCSPRSGH
jgi:hypothetical protein